METQSYTVVDVHNICMGCLTETNELLNIFDLETLDEGIGKLFSSFSGYQVHHLTKITPTDIIK